MKARYLLLVCLTLGFGCNDTAKKIPVMGNVPYTRTAVPNGAKPPAEYTYEVSALGVMLTLPADWKPVDVGQSSRLKAIFGQEDDQNKDSVKFVAMSPTGDAQVAVQKLDLTLKLWGRKTLKEEIERGVQRMEEARYPVTYAHVANADGSLRDCLRCELTTKDPDGKMGVLYCTQYFSVKGTEYYVVTMTTSSHATENGALFDRIGKTFVLVE